MPQLVISDVLARTLNVDGCWVWQGHKRLGYGIVQRVVGGKTVVYRLHRFMYEQLKGEIPPGLVPDHLCRVRSCVNPNHIEIVTPGENVLRGESPSAKNAKKTKCVKGHLLTDSNVYYRKDRPGKSRNCRKCRHEAVKRHLDRRKK